MEPRAMLKRILWKIERHRLWAMNAEAAHNDAIERMAWAEETEILPLVRWLYRRERDYPAWVGSVAMQNAFVLPAGISKQGTGLRGLDAVFQPGAIVMGTVVPEPQPGNPARPRCGRMPDLKGFWNAFGFNSVGRIAAAENFARARPRIQATMGVSVGPNAATPKDAASVAKDCLLVMQAFAPHMQRHDFFEVNISSPNTRDLVYLIEYIDLLLELIHDGARKFVTRPEVWVKFSPDFATDELMERAMSALRKYTMSAVVGNTFADQERKERCGIGVTHPGGYSGKPLYEYANDALGNASRASLGKERAVPLVAIGGITEPDGAAEKRHIAGPAASAFGIYTGLFYWPDGPADLAAKSLDAWNRASTKTKAARG